MAICIYASTAKKLDRPYSDLEIFCVVTDDLELPNKRYIYDGLMIEIDYPKESNVLKEAAKVGWDWPVGADQYRNRIVLFERNGWLKRLEHAVAESDKRDFSEELRWAVLSMTESLAALRNAHLKHDSRELKTRAFYMAYDTARVVFYYNRRYVLTTSWYWKQLFECEKQPRNLRNLVGILARFVKCDDEKMVGAAEKLWQETMRMIQPRQISIESNDIIV